MDTETAGPAPGLYSLLSIGACTVWPPRESFYIELRPIHDNYTAEAMAINQLSLADLRENGLAPKEAMARFAEWVAEGTPDGASPVFVAFNAPFDWMFVNDYFHRYLGHNPFGHKALDIKAYYMGLERVGWEHTSHREISELYLQQGALTHHALQDAIDEAEIFYELITAEQSKNQRQHDPEGSEKQKDRKQESNHE